MSIHLIDLIKAVTGPSGRKLKLDKSTLKRKHDFLSYKALNNKAVCPVEAVTGRDV